jgi:hypothetical protein
MSERVHTGQSEAIHSPDACANTVVNDTDWMSWSMVVVCRMAIPCFPQTLADDVEATGERRIAKRSSRASHPN